MRVFEETQRFNQWWLHLLNIVVVGSILYPTYKMYTKGNPDTAAPTALLITLILVAATLLFIYSIRLNTKIDEKGIHFRFFPFQRTYKTITWSEMSGCATRTYNPILEYGGWGYRGIGRRSKAFNIQGNQGIQMELMNGKRMLIGTQRPEEAQQTINRYFNNNERI